MELEKKILENAKLDYDEILAAAKKEAKEERDYIVSEVKNDFDIKLKHVQKEANKEIRTKERLLAFETKQAELFAKQSVLEHIFNRVRESLLKLEGKDLLDYVIKNLKEETLVGNEVMYTNKTDYDKYLKALSTNKKSDLVDLDLLNKALNTNYKLSNKHVDIKGGFILEGIDFDLNFALEEVINKLRNKYEREIVKELF